MEDIQTNKTLKTVLLVDDDAQIRNKLKSFFANTEYRVIGEAADGMCALEICRKLNPQIVLIDIEMPVMDGICATEIICKENIAHCVIMLTSFYHREYVNSAIEAGAFGYLTKPFDTKSIIPTIEVCFEQSNKMFQLKKNNSKMEQRLNNRVTVDRAKLMLMETKGLSEEQAYVYIKEISKRKSISMEQISKYLLAGVK